MNSVTDSEIFEQIQRIAEENEGRETGVFTTEELGQVTGRGVRATLTLIRDLKERGQVEVCKIPHTDIVGRKTRRYAWRWTGEG
jgi:hypothetical protein